MITLQDGSVQEEGIEKGIEKATLAIGLKMYRRGDSLGEIQSFLELSLEQYQRLLELIEAQELNQ
jgi:hypothetical protein